MHFRAVSRVGADPLTGGALGKSKPSPSCLRLLLLRGHPQGSEWVLPFWVDALPPVSSAGCLLNLCLGTSIDSAACKVYMVSWPGWTAGPGQARAPLTPAPPCTEQGGAAGPEHPAGLEPGAFWPGHRGFCPGRRHREGPPRPLGQLCEPVGLGWGLPQVPRLVAAPHVSTPQDPLASYDFNDYDPDPQPRYTSSDENR